MTTNYLAQPRASPSLPLQNNFDRPLGRQSLLYDLKGFEGSGLPDSHAADWRDDGRTVKRRKLENGPPSTIDRRPSQSQPSQHEQNACGIAKLWPGSPLPKKQAGTFKDGNGGSRTDLPALISRPWKQKVIVKTTFEDSKCGDRVRKKIPVPNVPDRLQSPTAAPRLGKCGLAGFFPWAGQHPEDVQNESTIRHGFSDRTANSTEKELAGARTPLFSTMKHKSGLDTLSELFSQLRKQRRGQGSVNANSTSKPPPRVTLTEAKRKQWLIDLANVDIPLRRLNRTIPQGIRGQALLEQCLINFIPINRAVWFVKCVGANEIRTLRRKGPATNLVAINESKWLTEWTGSIEQFLETTVRQCGQPSWRSQAQYAFRLTTKIYQDNLMERDHYLDWMVRTFAAAGLPHTPSWLILLQIFLTDLVRFCKRGKRLACVLLEKIQNLQNRNLEVVQPLVQRLQETVQKLARLQPLCLLVPDHWPKFESVLRSCLGFIRHDRNDLLLYLQSANEYTVGSSRTLYARPATPKQALLSHFDGTCPPYNIKQLCEDCLKSCDRFDLVVHALLEWCTTHFRHPSGRLHLALQMLSWWHLHGYNVGGPLFDCFTHLGQFSGTCQKNLRQVVAELSRSKILPITGYLQWLVSRGGLRKDAFVMAIRGSDSRQPLQLCNDPSQMLTELSLEDCDDHVTNLRNILLVRAGYDTDMEMQSLRECKEYLARSLPSIIPSPAYPAEEAPLQVPYFDDLCWTVRSHIGQWLSGHVRNFCKTAIHMAGRTGSMGTTSLNVHDFEKIRFVLESIGDATVLKHVLTAVSSLPQEDLLAGCVDTVAEHCKDLAAMGALELLQEKLCLAYLNLRPLKLSMPLLATSLVDLCNYSPTRTLSLSLLRADLLRGDRKAVAAACSPFSDGIAESLQQAGASFLEDFEAILQSEPTMTEETTRQLCGVLMERIYKAQYDHDTQDLTLSLCQLLARVRQHRKNHCDQLIHHWIEEIIHDGGDGNIPLLSCLVSTECVDFVTLIKITAKRLGQERRACTSLEQFLVSLFGLGLENEPLDSITYRFRLKRKRYVEQCPVETLQFIESAKAVLGLDISSPHLLQSTTVNIVLQCEVKTLSKSDFPVDQLAAGLDLLCQGAASSAEADIKAICEAADDLSAPFYRTRLELMASRTKQASPDNLNEKMAETFMSLLETPTASQVGDPISLLPGNMPDMTRCLRELASARFFASLPAALQSKSSGAPHLPVNECYDAASRSLAIVSAAAAKHAGPLSIVSGQIVERLNVLIRSLTIPGSISTSCTGHQGPTFAPVTPSVASSTAAVWDKTGSESTSTLLKFLPLLLQMTCLQRAQFVTVNSSSSQPPNKQSQREHIQLVVLLFAIALHPTLQNNRDPGVQNLASLTLDTAATLVDSLPAESLVLCARILKDKMKDPRAVFLFGTLASHGSAMSPAFEGDLQVVKEGKGIVGDWKVSPWTVLEGAKEGETWVGLGMFGVRELSNL